MTSEANEIVKVLRLRGLTNGTSLGMHMGICDIAADMIEELSAKVEEYEPQIAGLEIMLTTAQSSAITLQRRAEAAERDIRVTCPCEVCSQTCKYNKIDAYDTCDDFSWRGPCEENGGTA